MIVFKKDCHGMWITPVKDGQQLEDLNLARGDFGLRHDGKRNVDLTSKKEFGYPGPRSKPVRWTSMWIKAKERAMKKERNDEERKN